jgi:hypothetical protein
VKKIDLKKELKSLYLPRVHEFIRAQGATLAGKHHEIYLSDLRKAAPEKWKTVVRQPLAFRTGSFGPPK